MRHHGGIRASGRASGWRSEFEILGVVKASGRRSIGVVGVGALRRRSSTSGHQGGVGALGRASGRRSELKILGVAARGRGTEFILESITASCSIDLVVLNYIRQ